MVFAAVFASLLIAAAAITSAQAEVKNVKISLDWIIQGTHAPFFIAQEKGYFKDGGVTVDAIDKGNGATNVAVTVGSGAYQFGWVDMPSMILFNAKNPTTPLIAVYVSFDGSPLAFITRKSRRHPHPGRSRRQEDRRRPRHRGARHRVDPVQGGAHRKRQGQLAQRSTAIVRPDVQARRR